MDYESLETKLIRQQNLYIQQLEEQIDVYREKDRSQELLIEKLNRVIELLTEELSGVKAEKDKDSSKEN